MLMILRKKRKNLPAYGKIYITFTKRILKNDNTCYSHTTWESMY